MARNSAALPLAGMWVLVVEDDNLIAMEIESVLAEAGALVVGPYRTPSEALPFVEKSLSAAVLDIRLRSETVARVAKKLAELAIPFIFYTGQLQTDEILAERPDCEVVYKPAQPQTLVAAVASLRDPQSPIC
jgi:DNA-binding NtrC family response regulator